MFWREFVSLLAIAYLLYDLKKVIVVNSLPKWQLSGAVWKIWDSFPPAARSLTFNDHLIFHCGLISWIPKEAEYIQFALHNKNYSSLCRILTVESSGGGILNWSNRWASYPLLNEITRLSFVIFSRLNFFVLTSGVLI